MLDLDKWLDTILINSRDSIINEMGKVLEEYNSKNMLYSSAAIYNSMKVGFKELEKQIESIINKLISLRELNKEDWQNVDSKLSLIIQDLSNLIVEKIINHGMISREDFELKHKMNYEKFKDHNLALLQYQIEVQIQIINNKEKEDDKKFVRDVMMVLVSAFIGAFVKDFLFK